MRKYQKGFTLIEILVVIAIIAVLTGIGLASFQGAQAKARDAKRKGDLKAVATALQALYNDNQKFPNPTGDQNLSSYTPLTSNYIKSVPTDPLSGNPVYCINISTDNQSYTIYAKLENTNDTSIFSPSVSCNSVAGYNYKVVNP